jgi:hypothetical protein
LLSDILLLCLPSVIWKHRMLHIPAARSRRRFHHTTPSKHWPKFRNPVHRCSKTVIYPVILGFGLVWLLY